MHVDGLPLSRCWMQNRQADLTVSSGARMSRFYGDVILHAMCSVWLSFDTGFETELNRRAGSSQQWGVGVRSHAGSSQQASRSALRFVHTECGVLRCGAVRTARKTTHRNASGVKERVGSVHPRIKPRRTMYRLTSIIHMNRMICRNHGKPSRAL